MPRRSKAREPAAEIPELPEPVADPAPAPAKAGRKRKAEALVAEPVPAAAAGKRSATHRVIINLPASSPSHFPEAVPARASRKSKAAPTPAVVEAPVPEEAAPEEGKPEATAAPSKGTKKRRGAKGAAVTEAGEDMAPAPAVDAAPEEAAPEEVKPEAAAAPSKGTKKRRGAKGAAVTEAAVDLGTWVATTVAEAGEDAEAPAPAGDAAPADTTPELETQAAGKASKNKKSRATRKAPGAASPTPAAASPAAARAKVRLWCGRSVHTALRMRTHTRRRLLRLDCSAVTGATGRPCSRPCSCSPCRGGRGRRQAPPPLVGGRGPSARQRPHCSELSEEVTRFCWRRRSPSSRCSGD